MTFHAPSIVAFGRFFDEVSECLSNGAPLHDALDLIRRQYAAAAVVFTADDRSRAAEPLHAFATDPAASGAEAGAAVPGPQRLAALCERFQHVAASRAGRDQAGRYGLWVFRDRSAARFGDDEISLADILLGQLARGLEMSWRVGASELERTLYSEVTDRLYVGVVVLDASGRILRASPTAGRFLAERDGLQTQANRLRATCAQEDRELQAAIRGAVQADRPAARGVSLTKRTGSRSLGVVVRPIEPAGRGAVGLAAAAAVYIRDPEAHPEVELDLVRQLFDLTPAEAAVARRLAAGLSLEEAAGALDISRNTARAHLRSIFSKSGITRQTELVRLVLNSAVVLGERPARVA